MRVFTAILLAALLSCVVGAHAQDVRYKCTVAQSTGFHFERARGWFTTTFTDRDAYVVMRPKDGRVAWIVIDAEDEHESDPYPVAGCRDEITEHGWLRCEGFEQFTLNVNTLRFSAFSQGASFTAGMELDGGTPDSTTASIGYCRAESR